MLSIFHEWSIAAGAFTSIYRWTTSSKKLILLKDNDFLEVTLRFERSELRLLLQERICEALENSSEKMQYSKKWTKRYTAQTYQAC